MRTSAHFRFGWRFGAPQPYAQNPRTHTEAQVDQIARSIEEFGWTNPVLVDEDGGIIAGHGRLLAALKMGLDKVPTILLADLTPEQRKAYVIADNQLALNAGWDEDMLAAELGLLAATDYDLSLLGFSEAELLKVLGAAEEPYTQKIESPIYEPTGPAPALADLIDTSKTGELLALGFEVGTETVRRYRDQAHRRPPSQTWRTFLANHAPQMWACDFFTVHTSSFKTLYVFFFIEHGRRGILHFNVTQHPTAEWTWRQVIEATPWGCQPRYIIRDRDACYGKAFVGRAKAIGIETILTPFRAPKANAIAERMVGTFRRECLDHIIVLNERHLRSLLNEFVQHYNGSRPHQSLANTPPVPVPRLLRPPSQARVAARPVLGGLHHECRWEAVGWSFGAPQPHRFVSCTDMSGCLEQAG